MSRWPNTVTIGSFVADLDAPDDYRLTTKIEGWDSAPRRMSVTDRTGANGAWVGGAYFAARAIVHSGLIDQSTPATARAIADELASIPPRTLIPYTVEHETLGALQVWAQVAVGPAPEWIDDTSFTYSLTLTAPDPFTRATTATTVTIAAGPTVSHTGTGTFPAVLEVTTTSGGTVDLTIGSLRLRTGWLPSGAVLTGGPGFPNPKRTIRSSGGANLFGLTVSPMQWPYIVPGANSLVQAGTAGLSVRYFSTYA